MIEAAEMNAEKKRLDLVGAMKERKTFQKLRENSLESFNRAEMIGEQKIIDEVVSYQYNNHDE